MVDREPRRAAWRLGAVALIVFVGAFVAEMADPSRFGPFSWAFSIALVVAVLIGVWWARRATMNWAISLKTHWTRWNEAAIGSASVADTAAKVDGGQGARGWVGAVAVGLVAIANGGLFVGAWNTLPPTGLGDVYAVFAYVVVIATGALAGVWGARTVVEALWAREVGHATMELVREGRIGVWGVR